LYHVRQLCDVALWLDGGRARAFGPTELVLASYETHVRNLNAADHPTPTMDSKDPNATRASLATKQATLLSVEVAGLGEGDPPVLEANDLSVTVTASAPGGEQPNLAVMLERADRVCITAVGTHADGVSPVCIGEGVWRATVTFPSLPVYSGEYVVSAFLFDSSGTLIYEQWQDCQRFMVVFPTLEVGLVRLQHSWS
jgi:lipopolysaccharide transport system ATP-binding protein